MADIQTKVNDPLPYTIIFAFLFITALIVLTWTLSIWYKQFQCSVYPNIWCSDEWVCNNRCSGFNACFNNTGTTGLASCLYGPDSLIANTCYNVPSGGGGATAVACECPTGMSGIPNCFSGCVRSLSKIDTQNSQCCCCPGQAGCPYTASNPPPQQCRFNGTCNTQA